MSEINAQISEARGVHKTECGWHDLEAKWCWSETPDWIGQEDASAVLLEDMPEHTSLKRGERWACEAWTGTKWAVAGHADRKTAVALCWLKWKGIA